MKNTSSQPLPVRRTVCSEMANDGKQNSRRVHCSRSTACTSMTMVFEGIRSQGIDRETLRLPGLRGQGRSGEVPGDAPAQRQRLLVSPLRASYEPTKAVTWGVQPPRTRSRSRHDLDGVIQLTRRHKRAQPMVIEECQRHRAMAAPTGPCTQPITRPINTIMRALGDRRLHYLGALSCPMIARQLCHAAPLDPPTVHFADLCRRDLDTPNMCQFEIGP